MISNEVNLAAKTTLETEIFNQLVNLNLGVDQNTLRVIATRVAESQSQTLVTDVYGTGNNLVNTIPNEVIGPYNPVDLVSSNLGSQGLYNNISNVVDTQLASSATASLTNSLQAELAAVLPASTLSSLNLSQLSSTLSTNLSPTVSSVISTALSSFTTGLYSSPPTVEPVLGGIEGIFDSLTGQTFDIDNVFEALDRIDLNFANSLADEALSVADNFDINVTDNKEKLVAVDKGFMDPTATYPTTEYSNQPETNKLARGEIKGTEVEAKNNNRVIGIKLPFNNSFDEPESSFNGEYPYNKVNKTESGHLIEIDDTPGCERLHIYHRSGTYIEIDSNGTVVKRAVGSSYEIIDKNGRIAIRGTADISVNGACNIFVGNDANMEVIGNVNLTSHNDINIQAGGKLNLTATEEINIHSANVNIEADENLNVLADGAAYIMSGNTINMTANTEFLALSKEDFNIVSVKNIKLQSTENIDLLAAGDVNIDSEHTYINSGNATGANTAIEATVSNAGLLEGRQFIDVVSIPDPEPLRFTARITEKAEGSELTPAEQRKQDDELVRKGLVTKDELDDPNPIPIESESPSSTQGKIVMPDEALLKATELPGNYKISPNFTLDMMWRKVAISPGKHELRAQAGLTYGQIVYNLSAVALNILEPVKKLYPNMIITSCFRHPQDNPNSAHPLGLAVDMQFPGASRAEYYDIAVKLAKILSYDQLLLEYWKQANSPWIHVSVAPSGVFKSAGQRKVAWTFNDHRLYQQSLVNLA